MQILKPKKRLALLLVSVLALSCFWSRASAQTPASTIRPSPGPVVVEPRLRAPQVITVLHRINGLKMLRLLLRSGEQVGAVDNLDQAFQMSGQVHTNITAGLALEDGQTIAAWLPEAEVEVETALPLPTMPAPGTLSEPSLPLPAVSARQAAAGLIESLPGEAFARPDITIIERDGKRYEARYVGLDGITGLSLLKISAKSLLPPANVGELEISVGQRMRLFSPEPAPQTSATSSNAIYVRIGETEGQIVSVARGLSGEINRIKIKSTRLSPSNIGGIVVNDAGQTIGIIESVEGGEANVLSPSVIRAAATRVLARQTSVPRPWLGISGEPVASASLDRIVRKGWQASRAMSLLEKQRGILLNSVAPGSPAALAALRAGDVIVSVNDSEVKTTDDFSLLLTEARGNPVRFTIVRPYTTASESVTVELSESLDPRFALKMFETPRVLPGSPLIGHGIETVPLRTAAAGRLGTSSGLLVVYVQPASAAYKSGLRPGDVIEAINRRPIPVASSSPKFEQLTRAAYTLTVTRKKEKLLITVDEHPK